MTLASTKSSTKLRTVSLILVAITALIVTPLLSWFLMLMIAFAHDPPQPVTLPGWAETLLIPLPTLFLLVGGAAIASIFTRSLRLLWIALVFTLAIHIVVVGGAFLLLTYDAACSSPTASDEVLKACQSIRAVVEPTAKPESGQAL